MSGLYDVTLIAYSANGCQSQASMVIIVNEPIDPNESGPSNIVVANTHTITFGNEVVGSAGGQENRIGVLNATETPVTVQVMNMNGQVVANEFVTGSSASIAVPQAGIYLVNMIGVNGELLKSEKIFVNN
jgi:hypothetical protein